MVRPDTQGIVRIHVQRGSVRRSDESSPALDPIADPRQGRMVYAEREVVSLGGGALGSSRSALVRWCYLNDQPRPAKSGENS